MGHTAGGVSNFRIYQSFLNLPLGLTSPVHLLGLAHLLPSQVPFISQLLTLLFLVLFAPLLAAPLTLSLLTFLRSFILPPPLTSSHFCFSFPLTALTPCRFPCLSISLLPVAFFYNKLFFFVLSLSSHSPPSLSSPFALLPCSTNEPRK